jgi:hypothetical protein
MCPVVFAKLKAVAAGSSGNCFEPAQFRNIINRRRSYLIIFLDLFLSLMLVFSIKSSINSNKSLESTSVLLTYFEVLDNDSK